MVKRDGKSDREPLFEVVWPLGRTFLEAPISGAPISDLKGKVVGALSNHLFQFDQMLPVINKGLEERFPGVSFVDHKVFGSFHTSREVQVFANLPQLLRSHGCNAVIIGVGG